ncbi:MATH and LRR domain-containing protein PFE0570w isoform X2 [Leptopilina boulardi]|uniref:MATH and LRR domain-containing protein PFE0570w isoform X2 n=1 Tax=Leptopilina boulardi TaxID=63433 RepID=UPI0021F52BCC|nr:MATH and LRR domain-containing protein PFE0570w isoform X2 [Leptopilina boulardi]
MTDTSQQELSEPHTNGVVDGLTEEEKSKMRPADIDADMREMERRKRVEMMMNSRLFREELERIIETQMKDGSGPSGLLQQISEMMGPQGARFNANVFKNSNCVVPINDIRGVESMGYAKGEKLLRCKLASVFRLLDLYGWTQGVGGRITARLNQDQEHFLVNPYGLLYHEVTASSLVKVDMQGTVVEQGTTNFGVHIAGFQLHTTIHAARPDIKCIVHISTPSVTAISSMKCGLLPLGQESIVIGEVSNHQYIGGTFEPEEREKITRNLGPINKVMLLTNRGALCCGETVEEAFFNVYNTVLACETQLKLLPAGLDNMNLISEESKKAIFEASRKPPVPQQASIAEPSPLAEKLEKRWRIGGTEFEALMRMLDNAGFRTGYIYRNPLVKSEPPRPRNDVEVPPAVSSLGYLLEEEELYKQGLWKGGRKGTDRTRWLNSPNVYQKVEILETGTPDPKKITKWVDQNAEEWVTDGSPTHSSTPVKIESALQFVPKNTNPKEFKQLQQQIKDYRRADKISAGPQSHILEGVTWEEAKKMQDATISGTGEQVVLVGAASKGIIQRGFQHNAMVYKTPYAKNPFDAVTDQELDQYKKDVERKQKDDESQSESEALSSFNISRATHESSTAKSPIQSPVSVTSETEEESRDEPRVLRIATKQVPVPSQPEVVLSDVDATTEFLNEMRRSTIESRNNVNKRDNEPSSTCSSEIEGLSYSSWQSSESVDNPRLEVTKTTRVAEIMKPILMKIDSSALSFKLENNNVVNVKKSRPFHNSRQNNILKREFFENYEKRLKKNNLFVNNSGATIFKTDDNDNKLSKNNNGSVDKNGTENIDNRNNTKKYLTKKVNPKIIKDYKDSRDENSIFIDVTTKMEYSLKNNEEQLENDGTKLKEIGNISKTLGNKFKKRCVRKLNIPSKIVNTLVDNNLKNSVIKTHFHPLIRCSDVISSTDSDSISITKSDVKNEEIITVNCNIDHCQEINFTQHLNIDLEEDIESDLDSDPLSPETLSEPLQAPCLVQKVLDSNFQIKLSSNFSNEIDSKQENIKFNGTEQIFVNEDHSNQGQNVNETKNARNKSLDDNFTSNENETDFSNKNIKGEIEDMKEKEFFVNVEISPDVQIIDENFDSNEIESEIKEKKSIEISEDVKESINCENNEITPIEECETNEQTMTNEFNNEEYKSDHDSSVIDEKESTSDNNLNESFHSKISIKESSFEINRNKQDELQISSNDNKDIVIEELFLYFNEILATEYESFKNEAISSCEDEELKRKNSSKESESSFNVNNTFENKNIISTEEDNLDHEISTPQEENIKLNILRNLNLDDLKEIKKKEEIDDNKLKRDEISKSKITSQDQLDIKYEDFVKEISSSSSEGENNSFDDKEEESFYLKELFSLHEIKIQTEEDPFDEIFNVDYENIEDIEGFPTQKLETPTNVENIEAIIDEIFSLKHSDLEVDKLLSKVYKKIVDEDEEKIENSINKISPKSESSSKCYERRDSITDMINNININISSTITTFENLPETDNSLKYNLDPTNMSLIYSLTPSAEISSKKGPSSKNTSIEMMGLSLGSFEDFDQMNASRNSKYDLFDWLDLACVKKQRDEILNTEKQLSLIQSCPNINILDSNDETLSDIENNSTQGSDILELPSSTYHEIKKNEDESFRHELNSTVNEIINDLEKTEIYTSATNFVDDIIYDITCLNMYIDIKNLKQEATLLMQNRIYSFLIVKDIIERLISTLPSNEQEEINSQIENDLQSETLKNLIGEKEEENMNNFIVIQEIVHHIIDKFDYDNPTVCIPKELKETVNIELKKCPNNNNNNNNEVGLEGLLKNMKDDDILPCDCHDCLPTENKESSETQKDKECIKQLLHLMSGSKDLKVQENDLNCQEMSSPLKENFPESDDEDDVLNLRNKLIIMFASDNDKNTKYPTSTVNSSPSGIQSVESENFAEQEVTSESTDNDTKSDNSREKEILRLDPCATNTESQEVLNDQEVNFLWNIRENKIEENCKNERFQLLEKSPSFIHFGDLEDKEERTVCTCCLEVSIGEEMNSKLPPIEELNESTEFVNCEEKTFDLISPRSVEYFTCDASESWKSFDKQIDTTREMMDKLEDAFDENQNATYSISDVSDNDKNSEFEYHADVSSNVEARKIEESMGENIKDYYNNTTLNFADVSASTVLSDGDQEPAQKNPPDYMTYSYDTKEFMKLEKHLEEHDSTICCNFKKSEFSLLTDDEPKYEETSLYRVITQMNLADTDSFSSFSINNDSRDILE